MIEYKNYLIPESKEEMEKYDPNGEHKNYFFISPHSLNIIELLDRERKLEIINDSTNFDLLIESAKHAIDELVESIKQKPTKETING